MKFLSLFKNLIGKIGSRKIIIIIFLILLIVIAILLFFLFYRKSDENKVKIFSQRPKRCISLNEDLVPVEKDEGKEDENFYSEREMEEIRTKIDNYKGKVNILNSKLSPEKINYIVGGSKNSEKSLKQIVTENLPSFVTVYNLDEENNDSYASGFIIANNGVVVTNYHLFSSNEKPDIINIKKGFIILYDNSIYPVASVLYADSKKDIIIVKIDSKNNKFPIVKLGDSNNIEPGDEVVNINNKLGILNTIDRGIISGYKLIENMPIEVIQTSIPTEGGSSGSPIFNNKGQAIGILFRGNFINVSYAIPINEVIKLINK